MKQRSEMVSALSRSLSVPGDETRTPRHARSSSVPSPSHPALSHLRLLISSLRRPDSGGGGADRIAAGLLGLARLHAALVDLLHLPLGRDPHAAAAAADSFLRLADAHGSFRSAALALRQHQSEARAAIRRRDAGRLSSAVRANRRAGKDLARLAAAVKDLARHHPPATEEEEEVAGLMSEAVAATAAASGAIFAEVAAMSAEATAAATAATATLKGSLSSAILSALRRLSTVPATQKKESPADAEMIALERLGAAEDCIEGMEKGSDRVFRCLMTTRVSLLNVLTPSL